jgi:hypothetical protein
MREISGAFFRSRQKWLDLTLLAPGHDTGSVGFHA